MINDLIAQMESINDLPDIPIKTSEFLFLNKIDDNVMDEFLENCIPRVGTFIYRNKLYTVIGEETRNVAIPKNRNEVPLYIDVNVINDSIKLKYCGSKYLYNYILHFWKSDLSVVEIPALLDKIRKVYTPNYLSPIEFIKMSEEKWLEIFNEQFIKYDEMVVANSEEEKL